MSDKRMDPERRIFTNTFRDRDSAERGYNAIAARGYKSDDIHVIMTDETRKRLFKDKDEKDTKLGNKAMEELVSVARSAVSSAPPRSASRLPQRPWSSLASVW